MLEKRGICAGVLLSWYLLLGIYFYIKTIIEYYEGKAF